MVFFKNLSAMENSPLPLQCFNFESIFFLNAVLNRCLYVEDFNHFCQQLKKCLLASLQLRY